VPEPIQLACYDAREAGFFKWHADTVPSDMTRKISISVPLSDPAEYDGGSLELNQGTSIITVEQLAGVPIIFPSWLIHRVTPVTRGRRYSLVAWIRGPNWR
jgi:PKHD-type hydroxylase